MNLATERAGQYPDRAAWFEDDRFLVSAFPCLFPEEKFPSAEEQVGQLRELTGSPFSRVLDLCCGPGRHAIPLAKQGVQVTGVDRSSFLREKARARAFQPRDNMDPRDPSGNIVYDRGVSLLDTWRAIESLADKGKCRAIGLSDVTLENLVPLYEAARIKPAVVQVESHPYLPQTELLDSASRRASCFWHLRRWGMEYVLDR